MSIPGVGLHGLLPSPAQSAGRVNTGIGAGLLAGPSRSSGKVQVRRKSAGGAGPAGIAGKILRGVGGLAGIALLAACAGKVEPQVQYVRVEVPVQVPCRAPEVVAPTWAATGLRKTDSLEVKLRALLAERRQRIGFESMLRAEISACR